MLEQMATKTKTATTAFSLELSNLMAASTWCTPLALAVLRKQSRASQCALKTPTHDAVIKTTESTRIMARTCIGTWSILRQHSGLVELQRQCLRPWQQSNANANGGEMR